ncbi:serine protease [Duganella sp. HH101]|uniref:S1 family peptidase n=1 Tax=Duganella sp. HH101 TaxID=1781066 RepID=UPI0008741FF4|nr:serine protease [Duganella sp. HH101]OFA07064.1 putative periplasmic serine endoprotease DegP-like precursor [Duganella sp. HH101]
MPRPRPFSLLLALSLLLPASADELSRTIGLVKPSVVGIGSFQKTRSPALSFIGSGFVIEDGLTIVTAAHVVNELLRTDLGDAMGVLVRDGDSAQFRAATVAMIDKEHDLARLRVRGTPLPALKLGNSATVQEGKSLAFMGFPLGMVLGLRQVTHRCTVSAITPVATPSSSSSKLDAKVLNQLQKSSYVVFQLDGTAYPGNSGSPLFDPDTGEVIGVVNMVFVKGVKETAISAPSGIAYAIPASFLAPATEK